MASQAETSGVPQPAAFPVEVDDYCAVMSAFPTGVVVVTTVGQDGRPRGLTCSSLCSVTLRPPTLLVCLHTRSGTLEALQARGRFAVNLLHARGREAAEVFSSLVPDRFARVGWRPSQRTGLPWLVDDAFAFAECRTTRTSVVGDHAVVLGEVTEVAQTADVPLLYGLRQFSTWHSRR
jgi:flavin reductase (NADH)